MKPVWSDPLYIHLGLEADLQGDLERSGHAPMQANLQP
jgi:hypothetical protein